MPDVGGKRHVACATCVTRAADDRTHDPSYALNGLCALVASSSHSASPERAPMVRRVLVVEPDADARRALQRLLAEEGCEVATAADGRAAPPYERDGLD